MKTIVQNNHVTITSETIDETFTLLQWLIDQKLLLGSLKKNGNKKHKKHVYSYTCEDCQKVCRGNRGLRIHKSYVHGERSPFYHKNHTRYVKAKEMNI